MKTLSVLLISVVICQIVDETKSQQCPAFGSEESILGWMLQGHIYQTMMANIGLHCLSVCLKNHRCQSFNFVMSLHMCEFSDRTKEATPKDFIPDADRYYFRKYINRVPLGSISDLAAESCKEIKMSEGRSPNGKYWMSSIKPGIPVLAFCDMKTEDVDECTASSPVCHVNAVCNNNLGSYRCTCKPGYAGDGKICRDFNECSSSHSSCHVNAKCQNTEGSYVCLCEAGYTGNGKTCTGPPDPVAWFPLNTSYRTKEINNRVPQGNPLNVVLAPGPDGRADGSYKFKGQGNSYIEFMNSPGGALNVNFSMTVLCWLNYKGQDGPVFNYALKNYKFGVVLRIINKNIFVHFRKRDYGVTKTLQSSTPTPTDTWTFVGASYNHSSGEAKLFVDGEEVKSKNIGTGFELGTQVNARLGVRPGDPDFFKGEIAQLKIFNVALSPEQMEVSKNQL